MTQPIETIYENNVLKPITPIKDLSEHERVTVILCRHLNKKALKKLSGTLTHKEAERMQRIIDEEFEKVEGEW